MLAFATTENLDHLAASNTFYCDGTFYTCPSIFHRIYSIHVQIAGKMMPVVYSFLPGKSQATYRRFFSLLQEKMNDIGLRDSTQLLPYLTPRQLPTVPYYRRFPVFTQRGVSSILPSAFSEEHKQPFSRIRIKKTKM